MYAERRAISSIIMGVLFLVWGILSWLFPDVIPGSIWIAFAGGWILYGGITGYYKDLYREKLVLNILKLYPRITLEDLSKQTRISKSRLRRIINSLRAEEKLKAHFDPNSGELIIYEVDGTVPGEPALSTNQAITSPHVVANDYKVCPYCGNLVPKDAKFCTNCGASLE